jgi:16S rRNA (cytosine967-C5)-methyltransferase
LPISPARKVAYQILRRVETHRDFAVDLLHRDNVSQLGDADRRLVTELVMGVLRWQGDLDFQIQRLSGKPRTYFDPEVITILELGIYQIRFLGKIPKSAAVNEAVELVKAARKASAAGLVNAVLRKCEPVSSRRAAQGSGAPLDSFPPDEAGREAAEGACRALPQWLLERWEQHFGVSTARSLAWASVQIPPTTLRAFSSAELGQIQARLAERGIKVRAARFAKTALVVESGDIHSASAWGPGRTRIQDEASQLVGALVAPRAHQRVLDLCAAPGIKAAQLAAALDTGTLVACELNLRRLPMISETLPGSIPPGVQLHLVRLDATRELPFQAKFDRVLLDAPCSGTGTLARNPEIKHRIQPQDLVRLPQAQTAMLANALKVLAKGGRLVYATCSLEPEENERVVDKVLAGHPKFRSLGRAELAGEFPNCAELFDERGYFGTRPDLHQMDGFFAAVIVRTE